MITDETYVIEEAKILEILEAAGWSDDSAPDYGRIEDIAHRAQLESILKDSASFVFRGFGAAISNLGPAFFGSVRPSGEDYRA